MKTSEINSLQEVSEEQKQAILNAMKECAFWKITAAQDHRSDGENEIETKRKGFNADFLKRDKKMEITKLWNLQGFIPFSSTYDLLSDLLF